MLAAILFGIGGVCHADDPPTHPSSSGRYIPTNNGKPVPLPRNNMGYLDPPAPNPGAISPNGTVRPHTTLGGKVGSDGQIYRQSATFPGGQSTPRGHGGNMPLYETHWGNHGRSDHPDIHNHDYSFDFDQNQWRRGSPSYAPLTKDLDLPGSKGLGPLNKFTRKAGPWAAFGGAVYAENGGVAAFPDSNEFEKMLKEGKPFSGYVDEGNGYFPHKTINPDGSVTTRCY